MRHQSPTYKKYILLPLTGILLAEPSYALSLEDYWRQIEGTNKSVVGTQNTIDGLADRKNEPDLLTTTNLFFQAQSLDDKSIKSNPNMMGNKTEATTYTLGIQDQSKYGFQTKLYYNIGHWNTEGASQSFLPTPNYYEGKSVLELNVPLMRNWLGKETRATIDAAKETIQATSSSEKFKRLLLRVNSELIYWRLALSRSAIAIQESSVKRAQKIRDWNQRKLNSRLADKIDFFQADALLKVRAIDLKQAQEEMRQAEHNFNALRGRVENTVNEILENFDQLDVSHLALPKRRPFRYDVESTQSQARIAQSQAAIIKEKNSAQLDIYASTSLNGRNFDQNQAQQDSFKTDYSTNIIGIKLSMPLDFSLLNANKVGAEKEALGANQKFEQKALDQEAEWKDLATKIDELKAKYQLVDEMCKAQKLKFEYEKQRHENGRTTTFFVLQFEQDYATAQLLKLKTKFELISLIAQAKTFGDAQ